MPESKMARVLRTAAAFLAASAGTLAGAQSADGPPPAWAYPYPSSETATLRHDNAPVHVPGSSVTYTASELTDPFLAADWHPAEHVLPPAVVAHGRKPEVRACGYCHRADGSGGPENASVAGLPAAYILRQLAEFKDGQRSTALPDRRPQHLMIALAHELTEAEAQEAAAYFASVKLAPRRHVVEAAEVPRTYAPGWFLAPAPRGGTEALGARLLELPEDVEAFEHRDTHARFIVYAPPGSLARGDELARTGSDGRAVPCISCHGADLRGHEDAPPIAGRSPSYLARQLYDFRHGARHGSHAGPMIQAVARLTADDVIAVAAYVAAQNP